MKKCLNCDHDITRNYCEICGQDAETGKIDWKFCSKELFYNNFTFHNKTLNTLLGLLKNPGQMIRDYLKGKRIGHIGAIQLLFFVIVIHGILLVIFPENANSPKNIMEINNQHYDLTKYTKMMMVLFILLSSFGTRLVYKKSRYAMPEHLVLNFYVISFCWLISGLIKLLTWDQYSDYYPLVTFLLIMILYIRIFFEKKYRFKSIGKGLLCGFLILMFSFILILFIALLISLANGH